MVRCSCNLQAVNRTSRTNWNPGHRSMVVLHLSVQIIFSLLRPHNELKEILAMTQRETQLANELSNLMMQLLGSVNERRAFIEELEHFSGNMVAYKTREELKRLQKDDLIKVMEMRKTTTTTQTLFSSQNHQVDNYVVKPIRIIPDVKKCLKNGKLEKVIAIIQSCYPNVLGDLTVILKDLSGIIFDTIHYKVLKEERFAKAITVGAALILHNVSVFSHKH
ncbi:hypothetical protein Tco_0251051 [Tanacetum coccineum]